MLEFPLGHPIPAGHKRIGLFLGEGIEIGPNARESTLHSFQDSIGQQGLLLLRRLPISIRHLKTSQWERERHQERVARVKAVLTACGLPVMPSDTHIVPIAVGNPEKCKAASDMLLADHGIYIQPINYPTVPKGTERLRVTPSPYHDDKMIDALADALVDVWERLGMKLNRTLAAE